MKLCFFSMSMNKHASVLTIFWQFSQQLLVTLIYLGVHWQWGPVFSVSQQWFDDFCLFSFTIPLSNSVLTIPWQYFVRLVDL